MVLKRFAAGFVVAVALLLSGCSHPGNAAATVNGTSISEVELLESAQAMKEIVEANTGPTEYDYIGICLDYRIYAVLLADVQKEMDIPITDEERNTWWSENIQPQTVDFELWGDPRTKRTVVGFIDQEILMARVDAGEIDQDELYSALMSKPVIVNPRYSRVSGQEIGPLAEPRDLLPAG